MDEGLEAAEVGWGNETAVVMNVAQRAALPFPRSLPEFQRLFPDMRLAPHISKRRWESGFVCSRCEASGEPFRIASRPGVLTGGDAEARQG